MEAEVPSLASSPPSPIRRADSWLAARLPLVLAAACVLGLALHAAILAQAWRENPFTTIPQGDAQTYWDWAGRIAAGDWLQDEPFHAPPLYPYLLGLLRIAGGGLLAVYVIQALVHVATAAWLGWLGARLFRPLAGVLAAVLYLGLDDAVFFVQRVSAPTLQAFLVVWLWWELSAIEGGAGRTRAARAGLALGANVLANPMMLPGFLLLGLWLAVQVRRRRLAGSVAAVLVAVAALTIAPAPLHNWIAGRELVAVSTQGGLAFAFGNAPGADGTYHPIEGISTIRERQDRDALAYARAASGEELGWNGADRFFYRLGMRWRMQDPLGSLALLTRKVHWFFSGRNYSDSYLPALEIEEGFASRLRWAAVRSAWLVLPACVALAALARRPAQLVPAVLLCAMPFVSVVVLHYSSRYRVPAMPVVACLASATLVALFDRERSAAWRAAGAASLALALATGPINRATGFDAPETYRPAFDHLLGATLLSHGEPARAAEPLRRALERGGTRSRTLLAEALRQSGDLRGARTHAERAVAETPGDPDAARVLAIVLADLGEVAGAAEMFARMLALEPENWQAEMGLGSALLAQDRAQEALEHYDRALRSAPDAPELWSNRGLALVALGRDREAEEAFRTCLSLAPGFAYARARLVELMTAGGRYAEATGCLREGLRLQPDDGNQALHLAWILATAPDPSVRKGAEALSYAESLAQLAPESPEVLDVLAAALAECGRFADAEGAAKRAESAARAAGDTVRAEESKRRAELYAAGQPFRLSAPAR